MAQTKREIQSLPTLPSRYQIDAPVYFFPKKDEGQEDYNIPGIPAIVLAIHFYPGKVKYDLDLILGNDRSRIYNVDSLLVLPRK